MKIALNACGNRVDAAEAVKTSEYRCPVCGEVVEPKAITSKRIHPYFSHKRRDGCTDWTSDMSPWHYAWQERFPVECREVVLEKNGVKHRADVLINDRVIEFQHSPISEKEFQARNQFYIECGKKPIWIFDMTGKIKCVEDDATRLCDESRRSILKLTRIRPYLRDYGRELGYSLFFQEADRLYWIIGEEFSKFSCFTHRVEITVESFLKDFGCSNNSGIKSISELWREEKEYMKKLRPTSQEIEQAGKKLAKIFKRIEEYKKV